MKRHHHSTGVLVLAVTLLAAIDDRFCTESAHICLDLRLRNPAHGDREKPQFCAGPDSVQVPADKKTENIWQQVIMQ